MKRSAVYRVLVKGEDSSRPEHLEFNNDIHKFLWIVCPVASLSIAAAAFHQGVEMGFVWELWFIPPLFRFNEVWNPPDNDYAYKLKPGIRKAYWYLYSKKIPRHRSIFSHSLLLGTPLRFCIAYWTPILLFVCGWNYKLLHMVASGAIAPMSAMKMLTVPDGAITFLAYWYVACVMSDIAHMLLDKYNPIEWFIGER